MHASVIISTYNAPRWLYKSLWGFACQDHTDLEIVVADDGSDGETRQVLERFRRESGCEVRHVWHADRGFRKSVILNKAILSSPHDYLVFTDGDCIPRRDFVSTHVASAEPGTFLSGGCFKLPRGVSDKICKEDIVSGRFVDPDWLRTHGVKSGLKMFKLSARGRVARVLNVSTTTRATWNGHNASGFKADLMRVNGFDERMGYGGMDRELGERLQNAGLHAKQIRYSAICVHLDHDRPWRDSDSMRRNRSIRRSTRNSRSAWTEFGIEKPDAPTAVGAAAASLD